MRIVAWEDRYSVGIDLIDGHHQHLLDLLNRSYNAILLEHDRHEIKRIVNELREYADYHFNAEEGVMEQFCYRGIDSHVSEHETFRRRLNELLDKPGSDEEQFDIELIYFLEEWLLNHISNVDKEFAVFVKAKGYTG